MAGKAGGGADPFKDALKKAGTWRLYIAERDRLGTQFVADGQAPQTAIANAKRRVKELFIRDGEPIPLEEVKQAIGLPATSLPKPTPPSSPPAAAGAPHADEPTPPTAPAGGDPGLSKEFWADKPPASAYEEVQWVAQNWMLDDVQAADAPSAGCWGLREMMRDNAVFRADFYKSIWSKTLPSKQQLEIAERWRDDGTETEELIGRVEQAIKSQFEKEDDEPLWGQAG